MVSRASRALRPNESGVCGEGSGSTIAQHVAISGPLGFIFGPMMSNEMAKHFVPVLDDLARAAEA